MKAWMRSLPGVRPEAAQPLRVRSGKKNALRAEAQSKGPTGTPRRFGMVNKQKENKNIQQYIR